ncbi:MAG: LamG domain-containing protein [Polyangiaceae bacterium]|nr:LamG domain-containing protein [Polyangiaceae bacterium]
MRRAVLTSLLTSLLLAIGACSSGDGSSGGSGGNASGGSGGAGANGGSAGVGGELTTLAAEDLCAELARIACDADKDCCTAATTWPGAEASPDCLNTQLGACRGGLGKLATDPRTGYDAALAASVVNQLRTAASGCWETLQDLSAISGVFQGTGVDGASCTPEATSEPGLRLAALSCGAELGCSLYLNASGETRGRCEARTGSLCSHPLDCASDAWCDATDWKPGVTGQCSPLKANGWDCADDNQCESQYCDAAGRCAAAAAGRMCLTQPYAGEVTLDEPSVYYRLGDAGTTTSDSAGQGHHGTLLGDAVPSSAGALMGDTDLALALDGVDDGVQVASEFLDASAGLAIELWFSFPEQTAGDDGFPALPLLNFGSADHIGVAVVLDSTGAVYVNLRDTLGEDHELIDPDKRPSHTDWHHLAINYDGFLAETYLDGSKLASLEGVFVPDLSGTLHVGFTESGSHYVGALDELAIYPKALPLGRLLEHRRVAKKGPARTWPIFEWFE